MKFDIALHEKPKKLPQWLTVGGNGQEYEIVYHDTAPYEVMTTHMLPYEDTLRLKYIEEMVETYYNSGKFLNTLAYLVPLYESPFAFYEALSQFWLAEGCQYKYLSKIGL